ncbi:glycosyltransferase [Aquiflexum gelatinilyticum]|uniref:glycosyltransferase n=1 Tax=Aquiflexum gelatinilyticum TaxID=2961943 RepID=UPI00216789FC|nr:glycosyltransferase [Aquiflexum gelatinilyticum]MCS4434560.1 glycosyltransferase [Aquiflexum gelatinilyticum]
MKNILLIPSWYPTPSKPLNGSFFREQAEFLDQSRVGQFVVLYGDEISRPLFKFLWIYILSLIKTSWPIEKGFVIQNPEAYGFIIPKNRRVPEKYRIKLAIRLYQKAFFSLRSIGHIPDLIHAQSGMDAGIYAHKLSKVHSIPFVIIEHQVFVFHYYSRLRARLVLQAFASADKTAAVSYDERRQVLMNQPNCNPEVIWNLVDETKYQIKLEKRNSVFTIITILNSLPIKGYDTFLEAIYELSKETQDFKFIMIGKGADEESNDPDFNAFVRKSKELGVYEFGKFIPKVDRDKISDVLNTAHVFVSPTIQEPHGIAIREAMMCGLPVISTANGGGEDSVTEEVGLVVPVKNAKALANAILKLKNKERIFDPKRIFDLAFKQCGRSRFLKSMIEFYKL